MMCLWWRVLCAHEVIDPDAVPDEGRPRVPAQTPVETLLPMLAAHPEGVAVERSGTVEGIVTAQSVISALALLSDQDDAKAEATA